MGKSTSAGILTAATLLVAGLLPAAAAGDGLPVPGGVDTTGQGVLSATGAQRFLAIPRSGSTLVERVAAGTGQLLGHTWIDGTYSVPGVSIYGDTSGISQAGNALVLIRPRVGFPQRKTSMVVINPNSLTVKRRVTLPGDLSFDAISPDGRTAFLVQYPDPRDWNNYRLRTLDLTSGRLAPGSLLPENEPDEEMRGMPLSRASGADGRWQYTLYDGGAIYPSGKGPVGEPFVHAIDTVGQRTLCIDLEFVPRRALSRVDLRMSASGSAVEVFEPRAGVLGTIDTATGEASEGAPAVVQPDSGDGGSTGPEVAAGVALVAVLAGLGKLLLGARRRRQAPPNADATA